ncbi:MAG: ABC transporter permease [Candidatus Dormibacteraeota bacterium]|nr:ABC transporter permease [Candidatus Dormibacteraeota bacterium]
MRERRGLRGWFAAHATFGYLIRRLVQYLVTLWAAFTATFFFFRLIPGDPLTGYLQSLPQYTPAGRATVHHYEKVFDLSGNLFQQYGVYLYQLLVRHNLGPSLLSYPTPALVVVAHAVPWTVGLLGLSAVIAWFLGVFLGALAGWRRESTISAALTYCALALSNIPFFFVAVILVLVFAFTLNVMPATYPYGPGIEVSFTLPFILSVLYHALIPAFSLVLVAMFANFLGMRQQMITVLGEDYMTFAAAKGLRPWRILRRYGMPNCYLPQITGLMVNLGFIFSGNIILEQFFLYPGVGHLLGAALEERDFNTLMAITNVVIFIVLSAVFLVDLALPLLDPRIRYQR